MPTSNFRNAHQDDRWHGAAPTYFRLFLVKNILIVVLACVFIPESVIFRRSWTEAGYSLSDDHSPHHPWVRVSMALVPDSAFTFATAILSATHYFHPISALVGAIILSGMYIIAASLNCIIVVSTEASFGARDTWSQLCYAEVGVQIVIGLLHAAMTVYASKAVHRWRRAKQGTLRNEEFGLEATKGSEDERSLSY